MPGGSLLPCVSCAATLPQVLGRTLTKSFAVKQRGQGQGSLHELDDRTLLSKSWQAQGSLDADHAALQDHVCKQHVRQSPSEISIAAFPKLP